MEPFWPFHSIAGTAASAAAAETRATVGARLSAVHADASSWRPTNAARSRHSRTGSDPGAARRRSAVAVIVALLAVAVVASCAVVALVGSGHRAGVLGSRFSMLRRKLRSSNSAATIATESTTHIGRSTATATATARAVDSHWIEHGARPEDPPSVSDAALLRQSPYVRRHVIDMRSESSCKIVMPSPEISADANPSSAPFAASLARFANSTERVLLVIPRHGLGNSLRGFVSAFVFSRLSGRRLIRFHGGAHGKVLDALCAAFDCGFDAIRGGGAEEEELLVSPGKNGAPAGGKGKGGLGGEAAMRAVLKRLNFVDLQAQGRSLVVRQSIPSAAPLVLTHSARNFDGFWRHYPAVKRCVAAAFNCREGDVWCVHSHALQQLLPRPSPSLLSVLQAVVRRRRHMGGAGSVAGEDVGSDLAQAGFMFDIALHLRTRPSSIEGTGEAGTRRSSSRGDESAQLIKELAHVGCVDNDDTEKKVAQANASSAFLQRCLWSCLDSAIREVAKQQGKPIAPLSDGSNSSPFRPLSIFLATDSEELRGEFVNRLSAYGDVYYSTGAVVHSAKTAVKVNDQRGEGNVAANSSGVTTTTEYPSSTEPEAGGSSFSSATGSPKGRLAWNLPTMGEFFLLSRSHTIIEAGEYVSSFAHQAALLGNGTLAGIKWGRDGNGSCSINVVHQAL
ncbi:hypothetical protein CLOM_g22831 [Closterium sp. NIES-68]|nr:hypothetical protein CLOM_g22831 [Closterium sp. NIES-68]GJP82608.1 hypothetical protein CLOP_g12846 [Closterium sp. NIES-67]